MSMKNIYTSIDIGSNTIKVVVCELYGNKLNLLAASSTKSSGIKKGLIVDFDAASVSLKKAIKEIESMLGISIKRVLASVPSYFSEYIYAKNEITIEPTSDGDKGIITSEHINELFKKTINSKLPSGKEIVTVIPIDFIIDDEINIKDPKDQKASKLVSRNIIVTTPKKNIYSVVSLIEKNGIEVVDISLNNIGDIYTFKDKNIDEQIGAIINIGEETTTVSVYNKGVVVKSSIIQLGGSNINNDLSYIYKITKEDACKLKEKFALAHKMYASVNDTYEINNIYGETIKINQFEASEIVMARLEEILNLAQKEIKVLTNKKIQYIIVTGGTSNMAHFNYIADEVLGKGTIIGDIKLIGARHNKFSSAIGNILYFVSKLKIRGKEYSMFSKEEVELLSLNKKGLLNVSNESMLGKVFGYFWSE